MARSNLTYIHVAHPRQNRGEGERGRDRPTPRPRLSEHRIRDGEVVKERFVGPLSRLVSRLAPGRPTEARRSGGEAKMVEDLPDHRRPLDHGEDLHRSPAARTDQRIHLVDLADQAGPGSPGLQRRPSAPLGGGGGQVHVPEEPVLLAVAPRPIRVPTVDCR